MKQDYARLCAEHARLKRETDWRQREIAAYLHLSEGELLAAHVGEQALRLRPDWPGLLAELEGLGRVMALTRNQACVHEKIGSYRGFHHQDGIGLLHGPQIDLRIYLSHWAHAFALRETSARGWRHSLQFFDSQGQAIHKLFLRAESRRAAWDALLQDFADERQQPGLSLAPPAPAPVYAADQHVDLARLRQSWGSLRSTHDFSALLGAFALERQQALRLAGGDFAWRVSRASLVRVLAQARDLGLPIMVFCGNPGMLQIHSGVVRQLTLSDPWLNILDPDFSLHLRRDLLASAWVVRKPTRDGVVTSLELFDTEGASVAWLFGARQPGQAERPQWRALLLGLPRRAT
jgi:putative hemin transport protein